MHGLEVLSDYAWPCSDFLPIMAFYVSKNNVHLYKLRLSQFFGRSEYQKVRKMKGSWTQMLSLGDDLSENGHGKKTNL